MHPLNTCTELTIKNFFSRICVTIKTTSAILKTCPTNTQKQKTVFCEMSFSHQ
jgi:hypothetical protein